MFDESDLKVLLDEETVSKRIREMGEEITRDYAGKELFVVCVLKGAAVFMTELIKHIKLPIKIDFAIISSYGDGTESSGKINIIRDIGKDLSGKNIIIAEDIIDTGHTLNCFYNELIKRNPESVKVAALLNKPSRREIDCEATYIGFTIENKFVVGYGMDYAELYRNLPYIGYFET